MTDQPRAGLNLSDCQGEGSDCYVHGDACVDDADTARHDAMWGAGNWVVHEGCPDAADAGQDRAVHHREYHRG